MADLDLTGRVVIVTGGTGGVGRALVPALCAMGARVVYTRRPARPGEAPDEARAEESPGAGGASGPGSATLLEVDVTRPDEVERLVDHTVANAGGLYGVVSLVGAFLAGPAEATAPEDWRRVLAVNLDSAFFLARAAIPHLVRQGRGRIVTVAARAALQPRRGIVAYGVAKAAVARLTQLLAEDLRGTVVTANCVAPGTIDVEANRRARPDADRRLWVPTGALARVVGWLLSDEAAVVNGAVLPLEGPAAG